MFAVSGRQSTKSGVAPAWLTASAVAMKVLTGTMTSSPGPTPAACSARRTASVPELTPVQNPAPQNLAKADSKSLSSRPSVKAARSSTDCEHLSELIVQVRAIARAGRRTVRQWPRGPPTICASRATGRVVASPRGSPTGCVRVQAAPPNTPKADNIHVRGRAE